MIASNSLVCARTPVAENNPKIRLVTNATEDSSCPILRKRNQTKGLGFHVGRVTPDLWSHLHPDSAIRQRSKFFSCRHTVFNTKSLSRRVRRSVRINQFIVRIAMLRSLAEGNFCIVATTLCSTSISGAHTTRCHHHGQRQQYVIAFVERSSEYPFAIMNASHGGYHPIGRQCDRRARTIAFPAHRC